MTIDTKKTKQNKNRRKKRLRAKIKGAFSKPRFSVFRSNKHLFVQLIDDKKGKTLVSASDQEIKLEEAKEKSKTELAYKVGQLIAQKAREKKIKTVVFDRGGNKYHGRVKALAEGAREGGLKF